MNALTNTVSKPDTECDTARKDNGLLTDDEDYKDNGRSPVLPGQETPDMPTPPGNTTPLLSDDLLAQGLVTCKPVGTLAAEATDDAKPARVIVSTRCTSLDAFVMATEPSGFPPSVHQAWDDGEAWEQPREGAFGKTAVCVEAMLAMRVGKWHPFSDYIELQRLLDEAIKNSPLMQQHGRTTPCVLGCKLVEQVAIGTRREIIGHWHAVWKDNDFSEENVFRGTWEEMSKKFKGGPPSFICTAKDKGIIYITYSDAKEGNWFDKELTEWPPSDLEYIHPTQTKLQFRFNVGFKLLCEEHGFPVPDYHWLPYSKASPKADNADDAKPAAEPAAEGTDDAKPAADSSYIIIDPDDCENPPIQVSAKPKVAAKATANANAKAAAKERLERAFGDLTSTDPDTVEKAVPKATTMTKVRKLNDILGELSLEWWTVILTLVYHDRQTLREVIEARIASVDNPSERKLAEERVEPFLDALENLKKSALQKKHIPNRLSGRFERRSTKNDKYRKVVSPLPLGDSGTPYGEVEAWMWDEAADHSWSEQLLTWSEHYKSVCVKCNSNQHKDFGVLTKEMRPDWFEDDEVMGVEFWPWFQVNDYFWKALSALNEVGYIAFFGKGLVIRDLRLHVEEKEKEQRCLDKGMTRAFNDAAWTHDYAGTTVAFSPTDAPLPTPAYSPKTPATKPAEPANEKPESETETVIDLTDDEKHTGQQPVIDEIVTTFIASSDPKGKAIRHPAGVHVEVVSQRKRPLEECAFTTKPNKKAKTAEGDRAV